MIAITLRGLRLQEIQPLQQASPPTHTSLVPDSALHVLEANLPVFREAQLGPFSNTSIAARSQDPFWFARYTKSIDIGNPRLIDPPTARSAHERRHPPELSHYL